MQGNSIPSQQSYLCRKKGPVGPMNQKGTRMGRRNLFFIHLDYQPCGLDRHSILTGTIYSKPRENPEPPTKASEIPTATNLLTKSQLEEILRKSPHRLTFHSTHRGPHIRRDTPLGGSFGPSDRDTRSNRAYLPAPRLSLFFPPV